MVLKIQIYTSAYIEAMSLQLRHVVLRRDKGIVRVHQHLVKQTEKKLIKKEGQVLNCYFLISVWSLT